MYIVYDHSGTTVSCLVSHVVVFVSMLLCHHFVFTLLISVYMNCSGVVW